MKGKVGNEKKKKNRAWVKFLERSNALKNKCNFHNIFIRISKKFTCAKLLLALIYGHY